MVLPESKFKDAHSFWQTTRTWQTDTAATAPCIGTCQQEAYICSRPISADILFNVFIFRITSF